MKWATYKELIKILGDKDDISNDDFITLRLAMRAMIE